MIPFICFYVLLWLCMPTLAAILTGLVAFIVFLAMVYSAFGLIGGTVCLILVVWVFVYDIKLKLAKQKQLS